ncbi:MAG TPA: helix-turn-helix domain-containing protein [Nostocaceae cyanobacterium]|nr:helix-turn-helix domain-containing protein [Nostocaceae cyanobacterium]
MNSSNSQPPTPKSNSDVMELPDAQRQIVNWISRHPKTTLAQVLEHTQLAEEQVQRYLQELTAQGFIQELLEDDIVYYQRQLANKQKHKLPDKIWDKL